MGEVVNEALIIAKHRNKFPSQLIIPIAEEELLKTLSDKYLATILAEKAKIPIPQRGNHTIMPLGGCAL